MAKRLQLNGKIGGLPIPETAEVGQLLKVSAVNENGDVTALEAVDLDIDNLDPDSVVFPDGLTTTYEIGKVTLINGQGTLVQPGGTLADFFNVFVDEKNPSITQPSVSLTFSQAKAYEVGTYVAPSYSATLNPGSYSYGPSTGVTATAWEITDTDNNTSTAASGSFKQFQVVDGTNYKITAKATHSDGTIPNTNTGKEYSAGQIKAGSKSATSGAVTGYRNTFYGALTTKGELTSDIIRGLTKSNKALSAGSAFTVNIPEGSLRVVIAYPATLRDISSVKDVNGLYAEIANSLYVQTIKVHGAEGYDAIDYKVYVKDYADPVNANTYDVII